MKLITRDGYDFYSMASLFQKAIRRGDIPKASFAAWQLMEKYEGYLWNRMLIITAEDIDGMVGWAIIGLKIQQDMVRKHTNGKNKGTIFIAKAIEILCKSRKCRDACYIDCNWLWSDDKVKESLESLIYMYDWLKKYKPNRPDLFEWLNQSYKDNFIKLHQKVKNADEEEIKSFLNKYIGEK